MARRMAVIGIIAGAGVALAPRTPPAAPPPAYRWARVAEAAGYDGAYNFPVFVVRDEMWAFHPRGHWRSSDGKAWTRTELPPSGLNSGYQKFVPFNNAVYALGTMQGNYLDLHLTSRIARTGDFRKWEVVAATSNLPRRVFYGAMVHAGKIWLVGGFDGTNYYNDVWSSADAVHWIRVTEHAPWSPRDVDMGVVFKGRLWIIGGGVIDGQPDPNRNSKREVWSSVDGAQWTRAPDRSGSAWGGSPIVFDNRLWLIAANRNSTFAPALLVTDDGVTWREETAPWSARGAPAVWVFHDKLFMSGGKYSVEEHGTQQFIYRNDVWTLSRAAP